MMNPTKFGSPHLDTPNSRYDFCKFATKFGKTNKEKSNFNSGPAARCTRSSAPGGAESGGPHSMRPHMSYTQKQGDPLTGRSSPTTRSPVVRSPPLASPCHPVASDIHDWTQYDLYLGWWCCMADGGVERWRSGHGKLRGACLLVQGDVAEI